MAERIAVVDPRYRAFEPNAGRRILIHPRKIYLVVSRTPDKIDLLMSTGVRRQLRPHEQLIVLGNTISATGLMGAYDNGKVSVQEFTLAQPNPETDPEASKMSAEVKRRLFCGEVFYLDPTKTMPVPLPDKATIAPAPIKTPVVEETLPEINTPVNLEVPVETKLSINDVTAIEVPQEAPPIEDDAVSHFEIAMKPGVELKIVPKEEVTADVEVDFETPPAVTVTEEVVVTEEVAATETTDEGPKRKGRRRSKDR